MRSSASCAAAPPASSARPESRPISSPTGDGMVTKDQKHLQKSVSRPQIALQAVGMSPSCDLHAHSRFSTDSGNFALRRARLGESYTDPKRVYDVCRARGMRFVTISDHNTVEGALRIAHLPDTFLSVEVTTRFPEDDVPLHVLV